MYTYHQRGVSSTSSSPCKDEEPPPTPDDPDTSPLSSLLCCTWYPPLVTPTFDAPPPRRSDTSFRLSLANSSSVLASVSSDLIAFISPTSLLTVVSSAIVDCTQQMVGVLGE